MRNCAELVTYLLRLGGGPALRITGKNGEESPRFLSHIFTSLHNYMISEPERLLKLKLKSQPTRTLDPHGCSGQRPKFPCAALLPLNLVV